MVKEIVAPHTSKRGFDGDRNPKKVAIRAATLLREKDPGYASNFDRFATDYDNLLERCEGKFVAIVNGEIVGEGFKNGMEAVEYVHEELGTVSVLVKKVSRDAEPHKLIRDKYFLTSKIKHRRHF